PAASRHAGERRRVLLLEPSERWRKVIEEQLDAWHVTALHASSADECRAEIARSKAASTPIDAVIVCAEQSGPETSQLLLRLPEQAGPDRLPALLVTRLPALGPSEGEYDAELSKPLRFSELHAQLARALGPGSGRSLTRERVAAPVKVPDKPILVVDDN